VLSFSSIDYDQDRGGGNVSVDRTILGLAGALGLNRSMDAYGEIGYVVESELEDGGDDDGFLLGGGVKGMLHQDGRFSLFGSAGVRFVTEEYGGGAEGEFFEVPLGLIARGQVRPDFGLYAGLDVIPYSDGELDFRRGSTDVDRDDPVGMRLGADYKLDRAIINAEFALISEEAFILRVGFPI
jgi:hypothetical protein